jgi:GNAT superfamily N-acetyltransferase
MNDLSIRTMRPDEILDSGELGRSRRLESGLADDACFAAIDREGFLIGELDGAPAATVSCVEYGATFAFLGFCIVREDLRGRGYGLRIWDAAIAHTGPRVIGLDGVVARQQNYRKSGFELAYANVRCGGIVAAPDAPQAGVMALAEVHWRL